MSRDPEDLGPSQPRRPRPPAGAPKRPGANLRPFRKPAVPTEPRSGRTRPGLVRRRELPQGQGQGQGQGPNRQRAHVRPSSTASTESPSRRGPSGGNGSFSVASARASSPSSAASSPRISMPGSTTAAPSRASRSSSPALRWARPSVGCGWPSKEARPWKRRWPASPRSSEPCF